MFARHTVLFRFCKIHIVDRRFSIYTMTMSTCFFFASRRYSYTSLHHILFCTFFFICNYTSIHENIKFYTMTLSVVPLIIKINMPLLIYSTVIIKKLCTICHVIIFKLFSIITRSRSIF